MPGKQNQTIAVNRQAKFDYEILETLEAGLVLKGTEVKSIKEGHANIRDAYARRSEGEMWLVGAHVAPYASASTNNHEPDRPRKVLLKKRQIESLAKQTEGQSVTIIPLRLYLRNGKIKLELALARGKRKYDKRQAIAQRESERRLRQLLKLRR